MVNDHTRSAENWKCVWYLLRLYIYIRVYVDSHSLGQLALASKRTASLAKLIFSAQSDADVAALTRECPSAFVRGLPELEIYHAEYILHRISPAVPRRT